MKCSFWNSATKVAKRIFLMLLAITLAFSINLVKPVEVQADTCYGLIEVTASKLTTGCGMHLVITNPGCSMFGYDNANVTVKNQYGMVMYQKDTNLLDFHGSAWEIDISTLPGQTEMHWSFQTGNTYYGPKCYKTGALTGFNCCTAIPNSNWIELDTIADLSFINMGIIVLPTLLPPSSTSCITHYVRKSFKYNTINFTTIDSTTSDLTPLSSPNAYGIRKTVIGNETLYPGDVIDYELFLICNADMPVTYFTDAGNQNYVGTNYTILITKYQQYKQSAGEEFLNNVEAIHYDNTLTINTSLSPDFAKNITLHIYNSAGETVATETYNLSTGNSFKYDVTHLQKGAYYFSITTDSGNPIFNNKFIVIE